MNKYHNKDVLHINKVKLLIKDLNRSINFYENILGMHTHEIKDGVANLGTKDKVLLTLVENKNAMIKSKTTGLYHVAYLLDSENELANFLYNALKNNVEFQGFSDHGASNAIYLLDPDLNGIEVYFDLDDSKWFNQDVLSLTTKLLDVESLLKKVTNKLEFKMNNNTIIGHVHFSVSDLDEGLNYFQNIIGFDLLLKWPNAAFLSDKKYHHHIGMNVWRSKNTINRPNDMVGLISYHLNVKNKDELIERLNNNNIKIYSNKDKSYFYDLNNCIVYIWGEYEKN